MAKIALITGATSGIGKATAEVFAEHGVDLVLCGRREQRLQALSAALGRQVKVHTLAFDVRDREAVFCAIDSLPRDFQSIDILVNNAGNAHGLDLIHQGNPDDWDAMIDGNVKGFLYVARAVLPQMVARRCGHVINMGSVAGQEVYRNGNVYCASKFAVEALNRAMRLDLHGLGIKVCAINPGLVETEFSQVRFKGDQERAGKVYEGVEALRPRDIAEIIWFVVSRPARVNIADLLVFAGAQSGATLVDRAPT